MATRTIMLRAGDARDIALVDVLMQAAFDPRFGEAWTRSQCLGVMAMPGVRLTLALVDDAPAGFAMTRSVADEAELLLLGVAPDFRRRGVGSALLRSVEADCRAAGVATLHLEVRAGNEAVRLYTGNGFAKVGERRAYYRSKTGQAHDAHTYSRSL
ncbi:GNAT family N-acetyltransferase [Sphingomonas ginsenosidivorax]|uniref:GNAT family N-acetyltransferase n=1 Tax=Sphingomonas ginsenosidivorax TaxID=862135 RepID=A0A5C6UGM4_9SPHN|nr:GNAT family N-acetyltransferase [Sphingomonas ginsenosidivorax]TXC71600.1 GNAT family N-acetyltransferase [Sphingomonas ginsenosidivorax]